MSQPSQLGDLLPKEPRLRGPRALSPDDAPLSESEELILELVQVGVGLRKAKNLVEKHPEDRIRRQLKWLPHRSPRRPASLLIAAIDQDYDAPAYGED